MKTNKTLLALLALVVAGLLFCVVGCSTPASSGQSDVKAVADQSNTTLKSDPFYVLLVGNDSRKGTVEEGKGGHGDGPCRSDVIMLLRVDPKTYKVTLVSVPRDTKDTDDNGNAVKLNDSYQQHGMEGIVQHVEKLTKVRIDYYFDITFVQFESFINALKGVTVNVPINMSLADIVKGNTITLNAGDNQTLQGPEALVLARVRKEYVNDGDASRQINNRNMVQSIITKVADAPENQAGTFAKLLLSNCSSNMTEQELTGYIELFMKHKNDLSFQSGTGPYDGGLDEEAQLWFIPRDEAAWSKLMDIVNNGDDPTLIIQPPVQEHL